MKIIPGSRSLNIAYKISNMIEAELLDTKTETFADGELKIQVEGLVDSTVVIVQSTSPPVNDSLMELLLLADTVKRAGVKDIIAIVPYFGYSRQDKCNYKYSPISASLVIKMIETAGITKIITLDLHSLQLEGIFNIPILNLNTESMFCPIFRDKKNIIFVSPDIGGISRARNYSSLLKTNLAIISKHRNIQNACLMDGVIGEVSDKDCIIVDDMVDSANTLCMASDLLIEKGAKSVEAVVTHAILSGNAAEKISRSSINKIYISDSIYHKNLPNIFKVVPSCKLIGSIIAGSNISHY